MTQSERDALELQLQNLQELRIAFEEMRDLDEKKVAVLGPCVAALPADTFVDGSTDARRLASRLTLEAVRSRIFRAGFSIMDADMQIQAIVARLQLSQQNQGGGNPC